MSIIVLTPGPLTTVQDAGRTGYLAEGIGQAGVMDADAYAAANRLVGNAPGAAVLEMTLMGAALRFEEAALAALTGADMDFLLDGQPVPRYAAFPVKAGQVLRGAFAKSGCRGYLAVRGGIDIPAVLGSRSADLKCGFSGYCGRKLAAGDSLPIGANAALRPLKKPLPAPVYEKDITVRAVAGPQQNAFTAAGLRSFFSEPRTVSPDSDRMGLRLNGAPVDPDVKKDILSDGIVMGAVQISTAGQPLVLMTDHQTTGGYAKIACVITADLPLLAQARPGDTVRFTEVSVREAQRIEKKRKRLMRWNGMC